VSVFAVTLRHQVQVWWGRPYISDQADHRPPGLSSLTPRGYDRFAGGQAEMAAGWPGCTLHEPAGVGAETRPEMPPIPWPPATVQSSSSGEHARRITSRAVHGGVCRSVPGSSPSMASGLSFVHRQGIAKAAESGSARRANLNAAA